MNRPEYYAHSADPIDHDKWHRLAAHLEDTAARAASFLETVSCGDIGRAAGLLHDVGKYTGEFQTRLQGGPRVDHSTAGAKIAVARYGTKLGKILAFCIAGHHAGLANGVNGVRTTALTDRLNGTTLKLDPVWKQEITLPELTVPPIKPRDNKTAFSAAFFTRMLFSALVDADYLDTEAYFASLKGSLPARGQHPKLGDLLARLESYLARLTSEADITEVNKLRRGGAEPRAEKGVIAAGPVHPDRTHGWWQDPDFVGLRPGTRGKARVHPRHLRHPVHKHRRPDCLCVSRRATQRR